MPSLRSPDSSRLIYCPARIDLTDLWGMAGLMAARLEALGMQTPLALLRDGAPRFVRERTNVVMERMVHELRGKPCLDLEEHAPDRKSIMASRSFGRAVTGLRKMQEAAATHVARAAEKMRYQELATASLVVFIQTNRHRPVLPQYYAAHPLQLSVATADTGRLTRAAIHALSCILRERFRYAKAGVLLPSLTKADAVQGSLFVMPDSAARQRLLTTLDGLNRRYCRGMVSYARAHSRHGWGLRSEHRSARYTTSFDELLKV